MTEYRSIKVLNGPLKGELLAVDRWKSTFNIPLDNGRVAVYQETEYPEYGLDFVGYDPYATA